MPTYRDRAVILRKLDYGEADRIYTLLTRDHGKLGAIAKGVRRSTSRLGPALELFGEVDVLLAAGRNLDVLAQAQRVDGPRIPGDLERTSHAGLVAELADRVTEERHPLEGIYDLTVAALRDVALEEDPRRGTAAFMMAALELLGYTPQLHACVSCDRPLEPVPAPFSPMHGGFLCVDCSVPGRPLVSPAAIKVLRVLQAGDLALYRRLRLDAEVLAEVEDVLETQLEHHLDRRLKSLTFLRQARSG